MVRRKICKEIKNEPKMYPNYKTTTYTIIRNQNR